MEYRTTTSSKTGAAALRLLPLLLLFVPSALPAQTTNVLLSDARTDSTPTFRISVDTVVLNVGIFFPAGESVPLLRPDDFEVLEEGVAREIVYFAEGNTPLSIVLLIDCSDSMRAKALEEAKQAASAFVDLSHPDTEFSVIAFNDKVRRLLAFTKDRDEIRAALMGLKARGGTRLYDGIEQAIDECNEAEYRTHAIVLLTDGRDESSRIGWEQVMELVKKSDVVLFPCGVYSPAYRRLFLNDRQYYIEPRTEENLNPSWVLREIALLSGTTALFPAPEEPLIESLREITRELQQRYAVGFAAATETGDARYRPVEVRLKNRDHVRIQTRQGYVR